MVRLEQEESRLRARVRREHHRGGPLVVGDLAPLPALERNRPDGVGGVVAVIVRKEEDDLFVVHCPDDRMRRDIAGLGQHARPAAARGYHPQLRGEEHLVRGRLVGGDQDDVLAVVRPGVFPDVPMAVGETTRVAGGRVDVQRRATLSSSSKRTTSRFSSLRVFSSSVSSSVTRTAMREPSGDHDGAVILPASSPTCCASPPSIGML